MPNEQDTTQVEETQVETAAAEVNGTDDTTQSSEANAAQAATQEQQVDPAAEVERLRKEAEEAKKAAEDAQKERDQAKMRANQLENDKKKQEQADREKLEQEGNYEALAKRLLAEQQARDAAEADRLERERQQREADAQQAETNRLRNEVLKDFPEEVQKLAKDLDIWWDNADSVPSAQASLRIKLETLQKSLPEAQGPAHHANNPLDEPTPELREMSLEEMRKILPKADPR